MTLIIAGQGETSFIAADRRITSGNIRQKACKVRPLTLKDGTRFLTAMCGASAHIGAVQAAMGDGASLEAMLKMCADYGVDPCATIGVAAKVPFVDNETMEVWQGKSFQLFTIFANGIMRRMEDRIVAEGSGRAFALGYAARSDMDESWSVHTMFEDAGKVLNDVSVEYDDFRLISWHGQPEGFHLERGGRDTGWEKVKSWPDIYGDGE